MQAATGTASPETEPVAQLTVKLRTASARGPAGRSAD